MKIRNAFSVLAASALVGAAAIATAPSAEAGGIGNWYYTASCSVPGKSYLKGNASNYDLNGGADQRYHHGAGNYGSWKLIAVFYDGNQWPLSTFDSDGHSGTIRDGYQDFANPFADHMIQFKWRNPAYRYDQMCSTKSF